MTSWISRFEQHSLWKSLEELRAALDGTELSEDQDERDTVEFVRAVAERVGAYRTDSDPAGFTKPMLSAGEGALRVLVDAYRAWQDEQTDYKPVDAAVDGLIEAVAGWPSLSPEQVGAGARAAVQAMSLSTDEAIEALTKQRDDLIAKLDEVNQKHADLVAEQRAVEELVKATHTKQQEEWDQALKVKQDSADSTLAELGSLREQARNMVHDATSLMVGSEYLVYSKEKGDAAKKYDIAAVAFGSLGLVSLFIYLLEGAGSEASAAQALTRLGITLGALAIGGFLATRGAEQHREAKEARRTGLALSRMAPFIANLDDDAREVLTIETADRIFTRGELGLATERDSVLDKLTTVRAARGGDEPDGTSNGG